MQGNTRCGETEVTIPLDTYIEMLKTRGAAELENYGETINTLDRVLHKFKPAF